jgi:large subunit ribosomal protein L3
MKAIVGTKIGMTSLFEVKGNTIPATIVYCEPNVVLETKANNGVVVGYQTKKESSTNSAQKGVFKKANCDCKQYIRTLYLDKDVAIGDEINTDLFESGECVDVQALTRGRGYTGPIAR